MYKRRFELLYGPNSIKYVIEMSQDHARLWFIGILNRGLQGINVVGMPHRKLSGERASCTAVAECIFLEVSACGPRMIPAVYSNDGSRPDVTVSIEFRAAVVDF